VLLPRWFVDEDVGVALFFLFLFACCSAGVLSRGLLSEIGGDL
jgi:hypothetical protein